MEGQVLQELIQKLGYNFIALYQYQQQVDKIIPVFVIEKMDFVQMTSLKQYFENQLFIVLTKDDLKNGADIFALKFTHMQQHVKLFAGTDILRSVQIKKSDLRYTLELEIRNKLIQLREGYLSFSGGEQFLQYLLPMMELIWEGSLAMFDVTFPSTIPVLEKGSWLVQEVEKYYHCNGKVFDALYKKIPSHPSEIPQIIERINDYLLILRDKIDQFKV